MALDDPPRDGQPQAGALVLRRPAGDAREHLEGALDLRGVDADPVVGDRELRRRRRRCAPLTVTRGATPGAVNLIALPSRFWNTRCSWPASPRSAGSVADLDDRAALGHRGPEVAQRAGHELAGVDALDAQVGRPGARVEQQVVDHPLHALDAVDRVGDELARAVVEAVAVLALEQRDEARHRAQRLGQVVRGDVGEGLEVGVGALELAARALALDHPPELDADLVHHVQQRGIRRGGAGGEELEHAGRPGADEDREGEARAQPGRARDLGALEGAASSPMSVTHADSPVAMTWLGSQGTSSGCSLAARKAA